MPSYLLRRAPVVVALLLAAALDWDVVWTWSTGLALGSALAFARGYASQQPWARRLLPHRREGEGPLDLDFAYWWAMVGVEVRDLDVAALTAISSSAGGAYALPARLVKPMNMITIATISVIMPMAARRRVVTRREVLLGSALGTVPVAVVAGVLAAVAHLLPDLVGEEYRAAVPALRVLCLAAVITGFGSLVVTVMQTRGEALNRFAGYAILAFGLVQIAAAAAAGAAAGATAAAWAAVGTQGVLVVILTLRTLQECGRPLADSPAEPATPAR